MTERAPQHEHKEDACFFCSMPKENRYQLSKYFYGFFDGFPVSPGHMEVIPIRHVENFKDLNKWEAEDLFRAVERGIALIKAVNLKDIYNKIIKSKINDISVALCEDALHNPHINTPPDAFNHGVNDGRAAGRTINHFHYHLIPRYEGDVEDPTGGVRYVIPSKGNYKTMKIK